jgi:hypothetical protein
VTNKPARCRRWSGVVCSDVWLKLSRPWARELGELCGENHGGQVSGGGSQKEERVRIRLGAIEVKLPCHGGWLRGGSWWPRPPLAGDSASSESLPIVFRQPRDEGSWLSVADSFVSWMAGCGSPRSCWAETFEHTDPRSRAHGPLLLYFWKKSRSPKTMGWST